MIISKPAALMRRIFFYLSIILAVTAVPFYTDAQICSGTINTIWQDDFGSGTDQISSIPSPNITSGYLFLEGGVHEGHYGIANRLDYFGSWHIVTEDHTPNDINGYFLVIDGNNAAPIFYNVNVNNICPFTQYSFSTAVMNIDLPVFPSNQTFTFIISDLSGNEVATWTSPPVGVLDAPAWNELGFSFNSGNNTSLKLEVKFNQTGYDDFAFDDFKFSVCGPTLNIANTGGNTCAGNTTLQANLGAGYVNPVYQWQKKNNLGVFEDIPGANGVQYTDNAASDTTTFAVIVGDGGLSCPIIDTELVIIKGVKKSSITQTICSDTNFEGYSQTGIYIDTFTMVNGCDSIRTLNLTVNGGPVTSITNDTSICNSNPVQLNATGGVQYTWTPSTGLSDASIANPVANAVITTTYIVTVTGTNNCSTKDSLTITVKGASMFFASADTAICSGTTAQLNAIGGSIYSWTPANLVSNAAISNPIANPLVNTTYSVTITEPVCNQSATFSTIVSVLPKPVITATKSNDISCAKSSATLSAAGALKYIWAPANNLSSATIANPVASPTINTTYIVTGLDTNLCSSTASIEVLVNFTGQSLFLIPNSFTPNTDGFNDCFRLKYFGPVQSFHLTIYNRFGQIVYNSFNPANCWDGKYKGQNAATGNYIYHLQASTACGAVDKKGNVLLLR